MSAKERRRMSQTDVLVVDDESDICELVSLSLARMGLGCETAETLKDARDRLSAGSFRLCITDLRLPDGDGLELVAELQTLNPPLPVAVMTAFGSMETAIRALKLGAFDFVTKPLDLAALRSLVRQALRPVETVPVNTVARTLVGDSPALARLREQVMKLARTQAPVFIHGESGTGKEVIARQIHAESARADQPFVAVNCGAITAELMESEFFGHKKGSFTGAATDKQGLFKAAQGGTLFLDEVAELPLAMQAKLLRAIQERAVRPVGGNEEEAVDVRILSASHHDLVQRVAAGQFRQDLFFRINVITLNVPPLRERREDIESLANHILGRLAGRDGTSVRALDDDALQMLQSLPFPGNVRELENLLERACALTDGAVLSAADLQEHALSVSAIFAPAAMSQAADLLLPASPVAGLVLPEDDSADDEQMRVLQMLDQTRWNRSEAARRLGMTLRQLRYRLQKWGLE